MAVKEPKIDRTHFIDLGSDPVGAALHQLELQGALCCHSELSAPWSVEMPVIDDGMMFHVVVSGSCYLLAKGEKPRLLSPGQFTLVTDGCGHTLCSDRKLKSVELFSLPIEEVSERYEYLSHGGGGDVTTLFCGVARLTHPIAQQLLASMPKVIHIDSWNDAYGDVIQSTLRLMAHEAKSLQAGGDTIVTRLADILVIQALRSWLADEGNQSQGWLGALREPEIGEALGLIHRDPSFPWSVEELARRVSLSRSGFSARFTQTLGIPPMQYVLNWRMSVAANALRTEEATMQSIAQSVGYESEAAFARAFKRVVGVSPGAVKRGADLEMPALYA